MRIKTYTLRVEKTPDAISLLEVPEVLESVLPRALSEAEENINDLLPEGYYVKIDEWDAP